MARFYDHLTDDLIAFIRAQPIFFTASAAPDTRINLSPKGLDTLRVLSPTHVAYLDLTGSGNETAAHLHADGRLTIMFCSFSDKPLILRLYGRGSVTTPRDPDWPTLLQHFGPLPGQRQIITLTIESLQTSCGFAVPELTLKNPRPTLTDWAENKGPEAIADYWKTKNTTSIDGLPTHLLE
jgi:hypothetical protein